MEEDKRLPFISPIINKQIIYLENSIIVGSKVDTQIAFEFENKYSWNHSDNNNFLNIED
ncbi:hypothetical protein J5U18_12075 [Sphingobacteriaceae bacterium WQ 2009]|uniref:Uncharacterized protein n=1 Tax=Rhinopithecimicrobium faecis TaxID=2820698 RepID=A0A8T4HAZ9_9SPHI|nr:hypothetical protein [Sphingobacteriaceae bacterium WQ 2009]